MKVAIITIGRSGSSELISILKTHNIDVIPKPYNHLYPDTLCKMFGEKIKVIFITRNITDVIQSIIKREKTCGMSWIKQHYDNLNANFNNYPDLLNSDTFNFEKLFDSYYNNNKFATLFIKYEKLYFKDKQTIDAINSFLNTSFTEDTFIYNNNNKWRSDNEVTLSENDKNKIRITFQSLQQKIDSYNVKYRASAAFLIDSIITLKEKNSHNTKRHYRFSDVIIHSGFYWKESTQFILNQDHLKGSILRTYIEQCPDNNLNNVNPKYIQLLKQIIKNKINTGNYELPAATDLVIHLRLGDVVELNWFLQKDYITIIKTYIAKHAITKVTFCTAFHYGNNVTQGVWIYSDEKHKKNISKLHKIFSSILSTFNIVINVRSSADIDSDFIYMTQAKYFVKDEGGFSKMIQQINTTN